MFNLNIPIPLERVLHSLWRPEERQKAKELRLQITDHLHDIEKRLYELSAEKELVFHEGIDTSIAQVLKDSDEATKKIRKLLEGYKELLEGEKYTEMKRLQEVLSDIPKLNDFGSQKNYRECSLLLYKRCKLIEESSTYKATEELEKNESQIEEQSTLPLDRVLVVILPLLAILVWFWGLAYFRSNLIDDKNSDFFSPWRACSLGSNHDLDYFRFDKRIYFDGNGSNQKKDSEISPIKRALTKIESNRDSQINLKADDPLLKYIPLSNISDNNTQMEELHNQQGAPLYQIAVSVPLTNKLKEYTDMHSYSLGILRGVDIAQKFILDKFCKDKVCRDKFGKGASSNSVLIKVLVIDDENDPSKENMDLLSWIAKSNDHFEQLVGLIGHNNSAITQKFASCYDKFNLPTLSPSTAFELYGKNKYLHYLGPSTRQIGEKIIDSIYDKRKNKGIDKPNRIIVFFDPEDLGSKSLKNELCRAAKMYPGGELECKEISIKEENNDSNFMSALSAYQGKNEDEWVIALNINTTINAEKRSREIIKRRAMKHNSLNHGWIYLGHEFIDESFENSLIDEIHNKILDRRYFEVLRVAPWDWRSSHWNKSSSPFFNEKFQKIYGKSLNWYVVMGFNGIVTFEKLISQLDHQHQAGARYVRNQINSDLLKSSLKIDNAAPDILTFKGRQNGSAVEGGPGLKLCIFSIFNLKNDDGECEAPK